MLAPEQLNEIRTQLENSQNPIFFFDNDADGLCSFLLLRRAIGRGRGVAIKSFPDLNASYAKKIEELKADSVFILDKPIVSESFFEETEKLSLPVLWIDHHDVPMPELDKYPFVKYFNSSKNEKPSSEPTTFWCYKIAGRKEDLWLALCGCIGDSFLPPFAKEAETEYPELWKPVETAFEGLYETDIGKITRIMNFAIKDTTSNVVKMIKFMFNASPQDVLQEGVKNTMLQRFNQINAKYQKLIGKAEVAKSNLLYFQYSGDLSISADIANELFYRNPTKIIVVAYIKGAKANASLRAGIDIKSITLRAIEGIEGARGGGHKNAVGVQMPADNLQKFRENLEKLINL